MDKKILVTGGTGNMGRAVIEKFLSEGDEVTATLAPGAKQPDFQNGRSPALLEIDLADEKGTSELLQKFIATSGRMDAAILTVGGFAAGNLDKTSSADIQKMIDLNFMTAFNVAKPVFQQMKQQGFGRLFLIGARPALNMADGTGLMAYALSKSMIIRLAELLNAEAKKTRVVVHVVIPSTIDTPQNRAAMPNADPKTWVKPEQIAEIIHFYTSEAAEAIREPVIKIYNQS